MKYSNILINCSTGFGECLRALPLASMIKRFNAEARITLIVSPEYSRVLTENSIIDDLLIVDFQSRGMLKKWRYLLKRIKQTKFDAFINLGGPWLSILAARMAKVIFRGGLISDFISGLLLNRGVWQNRIISEMHELEYDQNLLRKMGIDYNFTDRGVISSPCQLSSNVIENRFQLFVEDIKRQGLSFSNDQEIIYISPSLNKAVPCWSEQNFAKLILTLEDKFPGKYFFCLSAKLNVEEKFDSLKDRIFVFNPKELGPESVFTLLLKSKICVGNGDREMLIANLLGVKTLGLYRPVKRFSSFRWGPILRSPDKSKILIPDVVCGHIFSCKWEKCLYFDCMDTIEVDEVFNAALELLGGHNAGNN